MELTPADLLEEVRAYGANIAIAGHDGIRIEFRSYLPASLQSLVRERAAELRTYLDDLRHEALFAQEKARYEALFRTAIEKGDATTVSIREVLKANLDGPGRLDKVKGLLASLKRALTKAQKARDSGQVSVLTAQVTDLENYIERHSRRIRCSQEARDAARAEVPDLFKSGESGVSK